MVSLLRRHELGSRFEQHTWSDESDTVFIALSTESQNTNSIPEANCKRDNNFVLSISETHSSIHLVLRQRILSRSISHAPPVHRAYGFPLLLSQRGTNLTLTPHPRTFLLPTNATPDDVPLPRKAVVEVLHATRPAWLPEHSLLVA